MRQDFSLLILLIFFSSKLFGLDVQIVRFNIGGYKTEFSRKTIEDFGGPVFNCLIDGNFGVALDGNGYIFIDQSKRVGRLVTYFIHTQELPSDFDVNVAKKAAKYFQIKGILKYLKKHRDLLSELKEIGAFSRNRNGNLTLKCLECDEIIDANLNTFRNHLIGAHQAQIEGVKNKHKQGTRYWTIKYRVPRK